MSAGRRDSGFDSRRACAGSPGRLRLPVGLDLVCWILAAAAFATWGCGGDQPTPVAELRKGPSEDRSRSVFEVGTEPHRLSLPIERPDDPPALRARARVVLTPGSVHRIDIAATVPPGEAFEPDEHPLVVGVVGERVMAAQVEKVGSTRRYQVAVDLLEPRVGELTVWAPRPLLDAGIRIEAVELVRWEAGGPVPREERLRVVAGEEERVVELMAPGLHSRPPLEVSDLAQRLRLAWTALGPPDATTSLTVTVRGRHGRQRWVGVRQPREGFGEVEIDLGPLGRGAVEIAVEVDGEVGAGLAEQQLVGPRSGSRPRLLVLILERLPQGALDLSGPMPQLSAQLRSMTVLPLAPFPIEMTPLLGSLLTGRDPLEHALGFGEPSGILELPTRVEAAGGSAVAWTERHVAQGLPAGFARWSQYSGGWPQLAPIRLLRDLSLSLVDDPAAGTLAVAAISAGPPWRWRDDETLALASWRPPPGFLVREQLRWNRSGRPAQEIEAVAVGEAAAAQLDRGLAEVWRAVRAASAPWSLMVVGADVGAGPGFVALDSRLAPSADAFPTLEAWSETVAAGVGLPRRGEGSGRAGGLEIGAAQLGVSEELERHGRILGWAGSGRTAWVELLPWGSPAPRLGGDAALGRRLQRHASTQLAGARLDIDVGERRMSLILQGSDLGPDRVFGVDGEVVGRLAQGGRWVELELGPGPGARVILSPRAGSPRLHIEGLELECGALPWVVERGRDGALRRRSESADGPAVVSYRPRS